MTRREPLRKLCECGTLLWDGAVPQPTAWIECWSCGRDYSLKVTWWFRLRYAIHAVRYKAKRIRQAYGGVVKFWLKEFYWLPREWEVRQGHHYWDARAKPGDEAKPVETVGKTESAT